MTLRRQLNAKEKRVGELTLHPGGRDRDQLADLGRAWRIHPKPWLNN
jgi:hypothetical protein